jgi:hypothetical protein
LVYSLVSHSNFGQDDKHYSLYELFKFCPFWKSYFDTQNTSVGVGFLCWQLWRPQDDYVLVCFQLIEGNYFYLKNKNTKDNENVKVD